jgi:hypothetical protein
MAEYWTCIECENLYDDSDGDTDERMCNKCLNSKYEYNLKQRAFYLGKKMYWKGFQFCFPIGIIIGIVIGYLIGIIK